MLTSLLDSYHILTVAVSEDTEKSDQYLYFSVQRRILFINFFSSFHMSFYFQNLYLILYFLVYDCVLCINDHVLSNDSGLQTFFIMHPYISKINYYATPPPPVFGTDISSFSSYFFCFQTAVIN
jgi:hypothetical protein